MKAVAAVALMGMGNIGRRIVDQATRYEDFILQARTLGLSNEQAKVIFEAEQLVGGGFDDVMARVRQRLQQFAEYGYLPIVLRDVLTREEIATQTFNSETILNDWRQMPWPLGRHFAKMERDQQRHLVLAAIELAQHSAWPLGKAVSTLMQIEAAV